MKVKSLLDKDFENINLKKVDLYARQKMIKRKNRSIVHQLDVLLNRRTTLIKKLIDAGVAYKRDDPKYGQAASHYSIGGYEYESYYISYSPATESVQKFFVALKHREVYLQNQMQHLKRSMKGMRSAVTRKEGKGRWRVGIR